MGQDAVGQHAGLLDVFEGLEELGPYESLAVEVFEEATDALHLFVDASWVKWFSFGCAVGSEVGEPCGSVGVAEPLQRVDAFVLVQPGEESQEVVFQVADAVGAVVDGAAVFEESGQEVAQLLGRLLPVSVVAGGVHRGFTFLAGCSGACL